MIRGTLAASEAVSPQLATDASTTRDISTIPGCRTEFRWFPCGSWIKSRAAAKLGIRGFRSYSCSVTDDVILPFPTPDSGDDTWQIGYVRYPSWVDEDGMLYRPMLALAVSAATGQIGSSDLVAPDDLGVELVLAAMDNLAETTGRRAAKIEVDDPDLAHALAAWTKSEGIAVACRDELPLLAEPMEEMSRRLKVEEPFETVSKVPGVTIEQLRAFAEAASVFFQAEPWRQLESSDIIEVAAPRPAANVRFACVMNAHGQIGLGLAGERSLLEASDSDEERAVARLADSAMWSVTFHEPWEVPIAEHDTWLDHGLATDIEGRIPAAVQFGPKRRVRRASPKMLAFFEGLFRALAETTEDELDAGQWRRVVQTSEGELELGLSLPDVLTPPAPAANGIPHFNPLRQAAVMDGIKDLLEQQGFESKEEMQAFLESEVVGKVPPAPSVKGPEDEARKLALEAMDTPGRRGIALARRALQMDPDSPTAHLALAMSAPDSETAVERYREAMAAAERALDPEIFEEGVGSFWLISETRPYMEARKGLGDALWFIGQRREAVEHYTELLRLNPNDNQGIRDRLAPALVLLGDDEAAEELLEEYADDIGAAALFNRALVTFRRKGDGKAATRRLAEAFDGNRHVADLLLDRAEIPDELPAGYRLGSVEEAVFYFLEAEEAWHKTPGALKWLADAIDAN